MAQVIYLACTLSALACAVLLFRGYVRTRTRLLLWSALCFAGLTLNNALVFVDLVVVPDVSLLSYRNASALGAIVVLLFGLVWEARR